MMKITSSQKLLLHNVLFHYLTLPDVSVRTQDGVEEIIRVIEDDLIHHDHHDDDDLGDEQEENVTAELQPYDEEVSAWRLMDLPPCRAKIPAGETGNLSFFGDGTDLQFDIVGDDGTVIEDGEKVLQVVRRGKEITLLSEDGDEKTFQVSKFPKEWTGLLKANVIYGVMD
jgi:hypothetical protein